MVNITYISASGAARVLEVARGSSLMQAALANGLDGIVGECGGSAMCATCHVYVDVKFQHCVSPPNAVELEMLESVAAKRTSESRLSCQLIASAEMDGLVLRLPDTQI
jgi:2Fe-2S ferredoxin